MKEYINTERKISLIKGYLEGGLSDAETDELQVWLQSSEKNQAVFRRIQDQGLLLEKSDFYRQQEIETDWKAICRKTSIRHHRSLYLHIARYAAVFIGLFAIALVYLERSGRDVAGSLTQMATDSIHPGYRQAYIELVSGERILLGDSLNRMVKDFDGAKMVEGQEGLVVESDSCKVAPADMAYNRIVVPRGGEYQMTLSDGTRVWLNSDSKLEFPVIFRGKERVVRLSGEAYFQVKRNEAMPFKVMVDQLEVKVLGTSFDIYAYDKEIRTTLVEGAVKVTLDGESCQLVPGEQAHVKDGHVEVGKVNVFEYIAWKEGKFVFKDKRLEEVLEILGRWYDLEIFYQNTSVKNLHFTGNIQRHASIDAVLKFLAHTQLVSFEVRGRTVIVSQ